MKKLITIAIIIFIIIIVDNNNYNYINEQAIFNFLKDILDYFLEIIKSISENNNNQDKFNTI